MKPRIVREKWIIEVFLGKFLQLLSVAKNNENAVVILESVLNNALPTSKMLRHLKYLRRLLDEICKKDNKTYIEIYLCHG